MGGGNSRGRVRVCAAERARVRVLPSGRGCVCCRAGAYLSDQERVHDHPEGPDIHFEAVADFAVQDLGRDVVGRAADGSLFFAVEFELGGQPEVSQLELVLLPKEQITELEVSVDDAVGVEVLECLDRLHDIVLHLLVCQFLPPLDEFVERLVWAHLEQDVHVVVVFEYVLKLDDAGVVQGFVDLDFRDQLLARPRLRQRGLRNDLGRDLLLGLQIHHLEAFGEAALSQQVASLVLFYRNFAIHLRNFFFDNLDFFLVRLL